MRRPRLSWVALGLALALALPACKRAKPPDAAPSGPALFTGKEPKRKVKLFFPARGKTGLVDEIREIYATQSTVNQAKQVVLELMKGPVAKLEEAAPAFGPGAGLRELFLDGRDLAVVDLSAATASGHPGGVTGEYATLACLYRSLAANFPAARRLRVLIDGQAAESLAGHFDLLDSIDAGDF